MTGCWYVCLDESRLCPYQDHLWPSAHLVILFESVRNYRVGFMAALGEADSTSALLIMVQYRSLFFNEGRHQW